MYEKKSQHWQWIYNSRMLYSVPSYYHGWFTNFTVRTVITNDVVCYVKLHFLIGTFNADCWANHSESTTSNSKLLSL